MPSVLITGANRGLGLGLTKAYLEKGWSVTATCRDPDNAPELKALSGKIHFHPLDVTNHKEIDALAKEIEGQPLDVLINNAGVLGSPNFDRGGAGQNLGDIDYDGLRRTLEVNTIAPLKVTEALLPNLELGEQKKLIALTSRMGSMAEMEGGFISYRTSKAALNAIMRNLSIALKEKGIAVAVLHPGWVKTDMGSDAAPVEIVDSVRGLIEQIDHLHLEHTGCCKAHTGETIPW
jgi:NAD(P)-dependent dehydrogenase (short-subunit alcohol dehydrogenase family)